MATVLVFLTMTLFFISSTMSVIDSVHFFQLNSYRFDTHTKWIRENSRKYLTHNIISVLMLIVVFIPMNPMVKAVALEVLFIISLPTEKPKKAKKPLVYTARVKRMLATTLLVVLAVLVPTTIKGIGSAHETYPLFAMVVIYTLAPYIILLSNLINKPLELSINQYYTNDAKKMLKACPDLKIIGITGSYGKTSVKYYLTTLLRSKYNVLMTPESYNTPMGVVKTIRGSLKSTDEIFVCEMGAKEVGNIKEVCDIASPKYGIITSVGPQHLETFKSIENVFNTKFELADAVAQNGGITYVNGDRKEIINRIGHGFKVYGTHKNFDYYASNISYGRNGSEFEVKLGEEKIKLSTKLLGLHSIIDIIGAVALAYNLGVPANDIQYAVASLKPAEHRLEMKSFTNGSLLIDDAYNSNPEGCLEAVRVLGSFDSMKKVIVTPGLVELGEKEYECNYNLGLEAQDIKNVRFYEKLGFRVIKHDHWKRENIHNYYMMYEENTK